jgi:hypothetical protein
MIRLDGTNFRLDLTRNPSVYRYLHVSDRDGDPPDADALTREDWNKLKELAMFLRPFKELTILLQDQAGTGQHGSVWETLPALELLLGHVE